MIRTHMRQSRPTRTLVLLLGLALGASAAAAQQPHPGKPDPKRGAEVADKLCSNCHVVEADTQDRIKADVPTFREIANLDGQNEPRLQGKMIMPAHPMPVIPLTRQNIEDLSAYILSLKQAE